MRLTPSPTSAAVCPGPSPHVDGVRLDRNPRIRHPTDSSCRFALRPFLKQGSKSQAESLLCINGLEAFRWKASESQDLATPLSPTSESSHSPDRMRLIQIGHQRIQPPIDGCALQNDWGGRPGVRRILG